jgi:uncharacterized protein (DUF433 family)
MKTEKFFNLLSHNTMNPNITIDPETMSGTPVFTGTRVPITSLFDWLQTETLADFLDNFPSVSQQQAMAVLQLAKYNFITTSDETLSIHHC